VTSEVKAFGLPPSTTRYWQLFLEYHILVERPIHRQIPTMLAHSLAVVALLITFILPAAAQRAAHPASHPAIPHFNQPTGTFAFAQNAHPFARRPPRTSLPFPVLDDFFNSEDIFSTGYPVASKPPTILLQAVRALSGSSDSLAQPKPSRGPSSTQPLMIELQNGRYVRINSTAANGEVLPNYSRAQAGKIKPEKLARTNSIHPAASPAQNLPPAVLVFRDGHTEEVRDYTIADGTLYARGDYYTDGYWNKKIDLSALNLAQTVQANNDRNVKFVLPSSPNEVIARF
jgi:hypothetical protein